VRGIRSRATFDAKQPAALFVSSNPLLKGILASSIVH
jgi:hypothetical protein